MDCNGVTEHVNGVYCDTALALVVQVCTFSGNRAQILRCAICDAVRGTSWGYYRATQAEASPPVERPAAGPGETRGRAAAQKGDRGTPGLAYAKTLYAHMPKTATSDRTVH